MTPTQKFEAIYESLFDNIFDGVAYCQMIFDAQGQPIDWVRLKVNKNFEKLTGLKNVGGKKVLETIPKLRISNPEMFEIFGRVSLTSQSEKFETYIEPLSRWFFISVYSPKKEFFVAVFENITAQKQIEQDLKNAKIAAGNVLEDLRVEKEAIDEAKAKSEAMLASIGDGLIAVDKSGHVVTVSRGTEKMTGWMLDEIKGRNLYEVIPAFDEQGELIAREKRPVYGVLTTTTTTTTTTTYYYARKDGTRFPVISTASPIIFGGKIIGGIENFVDMTKEKEINKAKSEFISIASHQLRTPVSGLNWIIEALSFDSENLNQRQKEYLKNLSTMSKRLIILVEDLLNVSRIELKAKTVAEKNQIDVAGFIEEFLKEIEPYANLKKHNIIFKRNIKESPKIEINKKSLYSVLQNLITNSIDYSPKNTTVCVNLEKVDNFIKVSVSNKGPAIPKDEQAHIFERFYRGESAKKMKAEGTGLGLYIVKMIIEESGGKAGFESAEGKDVNFWFTIPLLEATGK